MIQPEPSSHCEITITPKAIEMGKKKIQEVDEQVLGIRIGVRGGGCSGFSYVFDFAKNIRESKDRCFDFAGLPIVVDHKSLEFLAGCTLDWEKKLLGYGFKWINPKAKDHCGCGESFAT